MNISWNVLRLFAAILIAQAAWPAMGGARASQESDATEERPNVLFLLADDMGYADLGCFGSPVIQTPSIDRLASQGVRLTRCYAASPNCSPARAAILTGRHPYRVGMYDIARFKPMHIPRGEVTLPGLLREAGYETMFAGKWNCSARFNDPSQPQPGDHGFDHWYAHRENFGPDPAGFVRNGEKLPPQKGWMSEILVDETISWLETRDASKPFCAFVWFNEPHTPVLAAEEFLDLYRTEEAQAATERLEFGGAEIPRHRADRGSSQLYFGSISMLDHHVGRLLDTLDELQLDDNTIVVFTSDNGPEHRNATSFGSPGPLRGAKGYVHEGGIRVPGIIRWPGRVQPGTVSDLPVNGTDYLPTLCALAGVEPPDDRPIDGIDILPALIAGESAARPRPMMWWLYHARGGKQVAMREGGYKMLAAMTPQAKPGNLDDARPPVGWTLMRFVKETTLDHFVLYDLDQDPSERIDLSRKEPDRFDRMKARMIALHREIQLEGPVWELGGSANEKGRKKRRR